MRSIKKCGRFPWLYSFVCFFVYLSFEKIFSNYESIFNRKDSLLLFDYDCIVSNFTATCSFLRAFLENYELMYGTIYFKYMTATLVGVTSTSILSVLYSYSTQGNFDVDNFYRISLYVYNTRFWLNNDHGATWNSRRTYFYLEYSSNVF